MAYLFGDGEREHEGLWVTFPEGSQYIVNSMSDASEGNVNSRHQLGYHSNPLEMRG